MQVNLVSKSGVNISVISLKPMEEWLTKKAGRWALKQALGVAFVLACILAKALPIFEGGDYRADAVLYMLFFSICAVIWSETR